MTTRVKDEDGRVIVSTDCLVGLLGVSRKTLKTWSDEGCPKMSRGWWDLGEVLRWRGLVGNSGVRSAEKAKEMTMMEKKLHFEVLYKEAQAENLELKNDIAKGNYIRRDDVVGTLSRYHISLKRSLISLGKKISSEVGAFVDLDVARRIESQVDDVVNNALEQLAVEGVYHAPKGKQVKG